MTVFDQLRRLEPIFHTPAFGRTLDDFARRMTDDYWEVGASGTRYGRAEILAHLAASPPVDAGQAGWALSEAGIAELGGGAYLFTYALTQGGRRTRRATLWVRTGDDWQIRYHQGTLCG